MLAKLLFTLAVIIGVLLFFRHKHSRMLQAKPETAATDEDEGKSLSPRALAFVLLGLLIAVSAVVFVLHWQSENRVVSLRVIGEGETQVTYQVKRKHLNGRNFTTLDGVRVTLGDGDRLEVVE